MLHVAASAPSSELPQAASSSGRLPRGPAAAWRL